MVVHCTSRSPAFSSLIDGPLCLTDVARQSTQAGSDTYVAAASAATFCFAVTERGNREEERHERERVNLPFSKCKCLRLCFAFVVSFCELVQTATG